MAEIVLACSCGSVPDFAKKALKSILPPDTKQSDYPRVLVGAKAKEWLVSLSFPDHSEIKTRVSEILKKRGRYAFYLVWDDAGNILTDYDILHGKHNKEWLR